MSKLLDNVRATMKSDQTEGTFELLFTRTPGYLWAQFFRILHVHPIAVTLISIVLGAGSAFFFVRHDLVSNIIAIALLVVANWFDCADGQLARMTGKKTLIGRILDGFAGDVWFQFIYVALAIRLTPTWGIWGWLLGAYAGYGCHIRQANLADYYRQAHLFFQKGAANSELDNYKQQKALYDEAKWSDDFIWKFFLLTYVRYTKIQEAQTPEFQRLMAAVKSNYQTEIPQTLRDDFRAHSLSLIKYVNMLSFNTRAIVLYVTSLIDMPYLYPLFEMTVLMSMFFYMRHSHEQFCKQLRQNVEEGKY